MDGSSGGAGGFAGRLEVISGSTGRRRWPEDVKARIVQESFTSGAPVSEVARRHGLTPQQLTGWRRAARDGVLALPAEAAQAPEFVPVTVADDGAGCAEDAAGAGGVEVVAGRVTIRLPGDADAARIAAVAAALEARL